MTTSIRRVLSASLALFGLVIVGSFGYTILEDWTFLDSLWMTIITMSTVGFGEVQPLDPPGRILTLWLIVGTLLIGGYAIGNISAFLVGGEIWDTLKGKKLSREIERLKNHTVLIAYGRVGKAAIEYFPKAKKKMIVIERDPLVVEEAQDKGYMVLTGDATHEEVLAKAHVERASSLIIASGHVADNALIALTAREMNPELFIVARGEDYGSESKLRRAGANRVVVPNLMGGRRLAAFIKQPGVVDFLDLAMHGDDLSLRLQEVEIHSGSTLADKALKDSNIRQESGGALIMAVKKPDGRQIIAPQSEHKLQSGDRLILLGTEQQLEKATVMAGS